MKIRYLFIIFSTFGLCGSFCRNPSIESVLGSVDAIAFIRVTSTTEKLEGEWIKQNAILTIVGESSGLKGNSFVEVGFGEPSVYPKRSVASDSPLFILGHRSIVLLKRENDQWIAVRQIYVTDSGNVMEPDLLKSMDLDKNANADTCVRRLVKAMNR